MRKDTETVSFKIGDLVLYQHCDEAALGISTIIKKNDTVYHLANGYGILPGWRENGITEWLTKADQPLILALFGEKP